MRFTKVKKRVFMAMEMREDRFRWDKSWSCSIETSRAFKEVTENVPGVAYDNSVPSDRTFSRKSSNYEWRTNNLYGGEKIIVNVAEEDHRISNIISSFRFLIKILHYRKIFVSST